jgi:hypothetical protein
MLKRWEEAGSVGGKKRLFVGKTVDRSSVVVLSDADERPRLRLEVRPDGQTSIQFLDGAGAVTRTIGPDD